MKYKLASTLVPLAGSCTSTAQARDRRASPHADGAPPINWSDTSLGFRYGSNSHYPGVQDKVAQKIGSLTSAGGFKYGEGVDTKTGLLTRLSLLADLGALSGHPRAVYRGVGCEYWHNMYGTPASEVLHFAPGRTKRSTTMVMAEVHF